MVASFVATVATIIELADTRSLVTTFDASAAAKLTDPAFLLIVCAPVVPPVVDEPVTGMSLRALAWRRLRRDRGAMFAMYLLIFIFLTAIFTPLIVSLLGLDPYAFDGTALDPSQGSLPAGPWGGASLDHPLGVEPLTGGGGAVDQLVLPSTMSLRTG